MQSITMVKVLLLISFMEKILNRINCASVPSEGGLW
jgi:hypothetical protein